MLGRMSKLVHQEVEAAKAAVGVRRDCRCSHACMDPLHGPFTWSPTSHAWSPTSLTLKCVSSDSTGPSEGSDGGEEGLWGIQGRAVPIGEGGACMGVCMSVCMSAGYLCEWRKFSWDKCVGIPTVKVASMCTRRSSLPHGRDSKSHMVGCMTLRSLAVGVGIMHVCEGDRGDQIKNISWWELCAFIGAYGTYGSYGTYGTYMHDGLVCFSCPSLSLCVTLPVGLIRSRNYVTVTSPMWIVWSCSRTRTWRTTIKCFGYAMVQDLYL